MSKLIQILKKFSGQTSINPFYHAVADAVPVHLKHLYSVRNTRLFESDLLYFKDNYKPIAIAENEPGFCVTFDDGLREFKEQAWPILKKHNIPVVLFVNSAFVDNKELFFRFKASILIDYVLNDNDLDIKLFSDVVTGKIESIDDLLKFIKKVNYANRSVLDEIAQRVNISFADYLKHQQPYLTLQELKDLQAEGVIIGAHSVDHPLFCELSEHEQIKQIGDSVNFVNHNFNQKLSLFSFPFTDYGLKASLFKQIYKHSHFKLDFTFGTAGLKKEQFSQHIQRIPMESNLKLAKQILLHEYLYYLAKAPLLKNTIRR